LTSQAFDDSANFRVGNGFMQSYVNAGKVTGVAPTSAYSLGTILATGTRGSNGATIADAYSGKYAVIKLG
jgi:hypothetical protein